ncbi:MAG: serine hydrolase [Hyphomicrobiales bacterium]|nr:serine hydrolase [Hyphomicrobiales bacterium]
MKTWIKWTLRLFGILVVVGAILLAFNWERLLRLYNVNTLFAQEKIIRNFSNMKDMFFWKPVIVEKSFKPSAQFASKHSPLPQSYEFNGKTGNITSRLEQLATTSLLVVHKGIIVHEQYGLGTKSQDLRISWSMAKSFLSAMFGIAVSEGKISSIDDPVTQYVPALKQSAYDGIKIRDVLNMASGVKFDEDYLDYDSDINRMGRVLALGGSMDEFAASLNEREREAGSARQYVSIDTHVLAMVLRAATGQSLMKYLGEKIWAKVGSAHVPYYLTDGYGVAFALGGLNLTTRDYARFGQLFLNKGKWQEQQIVPADWVSQSTAVSAPKSSAQGDAMQYGYQWWIPPNSEGEFFAVGIYGQYIYIDPNADVVIVKTAANRKFRDDGQSGKLIKLENIAIFRAIARHYRQL